MNKDTKKAVTSPKVNTAYQKDIQVNNSIVCQGEVVNKDYLQEQASRLTNTNNQLRVILELLDLQACNRDDTMAIYFTKSTVPKINDALQDLIASFQEVADGLCPDD